MDRSVVDVSDRHRRVTFERRAVELLVILAYNLVDVLGRSHLQQQAVKSVHLGRGHGDLVTLAEQRALQSGQQAIRAEVHVAKREEAQPFEREAALPVVFYLEVHPFEAVADQHHRKVQGAEQSARVRYKDIFILRLLRSFTTSLRVVPA